MTNNTQELDDRQHIKFNILVPFLTAITIKRQKEKGNRIKDTETAYYDFAVDLITDWHNKQVLEIIGEDEVPFSAADLEYRVEGRLRNKLRAEQRNKLKELK